MKTGVVMTAMFLMLLAGPACAAGGDTGSQQNDEPVAREQLSDEDRAVIAQMELLELLELLQDLEAVQAMEEENQ